MITYKIYGLPIRNHMINNLKQQLSISDDDVYYDDRPNGGLAIYTAKKAWLSPIDPNETHRVVFPDDMDVCNGFTDICTQIVRTHPKAIISFFCWEGRQFDERLENLTSPYIDSLSVIGAGILMPVQYIESCFSWIKDRYDDNVADDAGIQYWAKSNGIQVITTIPSLVQHLGDDSILTPNAVIRRSVYFNKEVSDSIDWSNKEVIKIHKEPDFRPRSKNVIKAYD